MSPPPLLLRGARIVGRDSRTGGSGDPVDVLLAGGRVVAIGDPAADGLEDVVAAAEPVDLDGRWLLPGLWDAHVHMRQHALARRRLDLSGAGSAAGAAALVRDRAATPAGGDGLVVGHGFRDGLWPDAPHRDLLDAAAPDVPVVLGSADLHCGWLNTRALERFGHPDHPTGLLREDDWYPVGRVADQVSPATADACVAEAAAAAAARGVVGVVELEQAPNPDEWTRRVQDGTRDLRVVCGVYEPHLPDAIARGWRTGDALPGTDGLVTMGPFKAITDGSLNTRTAYCHDPYPGLEGGPDAHGVLTTPFDRLVVLMRRAIAHGIETAIHAIGDHANQIVLDAFETTGARGSVEHAQLVSDVDFPRFARLGVVASIQPEHLVDDRDVADRYWSGRTGRAFAYGSLRDAGAELALGSDAPVAPLDPWVTIASAVHRTRDGRAPWHPEQSLLPADALAASTRGRRTVRAWEVADLAVVDRNPGTATLDELRAMPVHATLLGGRWTWRADRG